MDRPGDGWSWFEPTPAGTEETAVRDAFVRVFGSDAGRQVLAHLRRLTIERRLPPDAPDALLRFVEGQRSLVGQIEWLATADHVRGKFNGTK